MKKIYKTIGEVARELNLVDKKTGQLQTHTIRYWETQFKQILRERKLREGKNFQSDELTLANFLLAYVEGKMNQFVRSNFSARPSEQFEKQWPELQKIWL